MAAGSGGRAEAVGRSLAADVGGAVARVLPGWLVKVAAVSGGLLPLIRSRLSAGGGRLG